MTRSTSQSMGCQNRALCNANHRADQSLQARCFVQRIRPQQYFEMGSQHDLLVGADDANGVIGVQESAGRGELVRLDTASLCPPRP
jgi:hypothetical protein